MWYVIRRGGAVFANVEKKNDDQGVAKGFNYGWVVNK